MFSKILSVLAVLPLASALAGVPDLTGSLEYLGNPAASRWPTSSKSRHVQDLQPHRGKIYTSGGEWGNNTGPCPCFAVDPYSGAFMNEFDAGTDAIYEFKEFSDGRLYTSAVDPHENAANIGHTFRRGATGTWSAYRNCHGGNLSDLGSSGYPIHNWDMVEYGDKVFVCGYGISGSTNRCETKMFNATPTLTSSSRKVAAASWTDSSGGKYNAPYGYSLYRRFCAFLPFDDDLFCVTTQPTLKNDRQTWNEWEEWRWDASQKRFNCQTNTWTYVAPGVTDSMMDIFSYSDGLETLQLWHPTKFKNRVLYIVGGHNYNITPIAAYSAVNENHTIKATRLDLGATSVKPFDIYATADAVYLVAAQAGTTTSTVTNSVWKSTDGVAFTPLFTFTSTRQASALCYYDGAFYFGMGANDYTKTCWPKVTGTDVSGRIYRVRLPQEEKPSVVATTDAIATTEGAKGAKAGFCLAVRPATHVTLQVSATHPAIVVSPTQLTFTSADWSTAQEVTVDIAEDDDSLADIRGSVVCSAADASFFSGYVSVVATNNDFRAVETAPEGLVDLTSPSGTFEATSGAVTMLPFNDETNLNQTTNRVCIQKTDFSITYDFGTATHVDAYGIYNLACNTQTTRPPKVWTFAGSDDKTAWTQLDQRRYETNWTSGEYRYYSFANAKKYRYYRIAFTANNGDSYTQFAHLEYYSVKPPTDASDDERYTGAAVDNASLRTPGDRTDLLEFVGNPNAARWNEPSKRPVTDLKVYQGKLFVGGGATELNAGPCPLQHIDPYSKAITVEKTAGTENITLFKELSDGRLYVPSQDPRDYDSDYSDDGHVFVRDPSGDWKFYKNVPKGSAKDTDGKITEAYIHNWDIEEYKGRTFVCGYGISFTTNGCASWTSATPHWTSSRMPCYYPTNVWDYTKKQWKGPSGAASYNTYRREVQFMKFADRLLAIPYQNVPAGIPKQYYDGIVEVHRFDETTQRFVQMTNRCSRVFPGLSTNDFKMAKLVNTYGVPYLTDSLKLWHTTPFSNRVFYVVSPYETYTNLWGSARSGYRETQYPYPMFACAADPTDDGLFTSTRLDFGEEEYPFEFLVKGSELFALTAHYNASDKMVRHTVWRTRDANSFERLFTFNFHQYLISMEYDDGRFYFGAGYKGASQMTYPLDNTADASGSVYRIPYPLETYSVVAETNHLATVEGGQGTVRFRLAAPPSSAVTLQVRATGDAALLVETTELTFSSEDWNCWKPVTYRVAQDDEQVAHQVSALVCGSEEASVTSASVRLTIEDDDADRDEESTDPDPGTNPDPGPGLGTDPEPPTTSVNYWIAAEGSDGLASTAGNWSAGVPTAASDIVISPTNSSVTLIWDAAAPQTINSYRQYGLTNEVRTTFSTEFPVLTVTGDMIVEDGVLTHPRGAANVSANVSRLKLSVGGDFLLGTNATVNLKGKGLAGGQKPTGSTAGSHAASCDGYAKVYGNVYRPEHPGSGSNGSNMWGGGALWLEVAGAVTIDGTITVRPEEKDNIKQPAAGSVYVKAASCAGSGHIFADYAATSYYNGGAGSGGRVAIELTEAATLGLAESHISVHGINAGGANGGGGTIFVKTADATMPNGTLILDDTRAKSYGARWHKPTAVTAIPSGETWTFDAIKIRNYGVLAVPAGTKLVLPKGVASVTASSQRLGGILYQGGEIDFGEGPYEFAQPWIFQANKPYTFNGNVTVKAGGALGCLQFMGSNDLSDFTKCDVVVNGDLTVEKGGYIWAESAGPDLNIDRTTSAYHGGQTGVLTYAAVYDSILDPSLPGWGMATGDRATSQPGGGVLKLTVNGALTVDGTVTAYANKNSNNSEGAGGTINIRAKTLAGEGSIMADSYKFTSQQYAGGGGRIAVRLSEQAVGTDGIFARITAKGATVVTSGGYKPNHSSSAGTVYLQGKDDAEGAGTIRVCNDGNAQSVDPYTPFPSKGNGAEAVDALKNASLFVGSCAKVKLFEAVEVQALAFDATGRLDLNGQTLTVASATVNGETLAAGTYRADASRTWLVDSSTEAVGRLVVVGGTAPGLDPEADTPIVSGSSVGVVTSGGGTAGESVFSISIGNVKAGLYYTTFIAEKLGDTFKASDGSVRATADGGLAFELPTGGKASLFVKVVVSSAPYSAGAELK